MSRSRLYFQSNRLLIAGLSAMALNGCQTPLQSDQVNAQIESLRTAYRAPQNDSQSKADASELGRWTIRADSPPLSGDTVADVMRLSKQCQPHCRLEVGPSSGGSRVDQARHASLKSKAIATQLNTIGLSFSPSYNPSLPAETLRLSKAAAQEGKAK